MAALCSGVAYLQAMNKSTGETSLFRRAADGRRELLFATNGKKNGGEKLSAVVAASFFSSHIGQSLSPHAERASPQKTGIYRSDTEAADLQILLLSAKSVAAVKIAAVKPTCLK